MKTTMKINTVLMLLALGAAQSSWAGGYLKIGDIKGESADGQQTNLTMNRSAPPVQQGVKATEGPQAQATMTPEEAEKLRKAIKDAIKKPPCGMNENC